MCLQLSEVSSTNNACSEPTSIAYVCRVHLDVLHCSVHVEGCGFASLEYNSNGLWHMTLYIDHLLLLSTAVSKQSIFYCTGCQSLNGSNFQYKLCLLVHKSLLGHTPEYISDLLTSVPNIPGRSALRASSCNNLVVPRTRPRIDVRACSVAALRAWNRLLTELKLLRSTDSFCRDLETLLFHFVYGHQDTDWLCDVSSVF